MYLENVVVDAVDPRALGRFWEAALGTEKLTDEPEGYETRLETPGGPVIDLCFQRVADPPTGPRRLRLHLDESLVDLGPVHADPEGHPFSVGAAGAAYAGGGPVLALRLEVADPVRDRAFWQWLTGWVPVDDGTVALRHPSGTGPLLELSPEAEPKGPGKNRMHLDVRLEPGDDPDAVARGILERGGREREHPEWGDLPWRFFEDPSGNEVCALPAPR
jgi:hypothetical protein